MMPSHDGSASVFLGGTFINVGLGRPSVVAKPYIFYVYTIQISITTESLPKLIPSIALKNIG